MTDAELVERAPRDPAASALLFEKYSAYVSAVARRRGARDVDAVVSEVFLWLLVGRWRLDPKHVAADGSIKSFVAVLTRYAVSRVSWLERDHESIDAMVGRDERTRLEPGRWLLAPVLNPEQILLRVERLEAWQRAFATLPDWLRQVAYLRYFEKLSGPEIAHVIDVAPQTIPGYLYQIRARLRGNLNTFYRLPEPNGRQRGGHIRIDRSERCA